MHLGTCKWIPNHFYKVVFAFICWCVGVCGYVGVNYIVSISSELPERLDEQPGSFITRTIQTDPHGVFLKQSRQALVNGQILIALHVQ